MCANWSGENRDMSPDRNERYSIDNAALQRGLGLPIHFLGVSLHGDLNRLRRNGGRGRGSCRKNQNPQNRNGKGPIRQTVDGIPIRKLYITNISIETTRQEICNLFGFYGVIVSVYMAISKNDDSKQFAFVTFFNPMDATRVLSLAKLPDRRGRTLYINAADTWHQPREGPDGKIDWKGGRKPPSKQEEENEEDGELFNEGVPSCIETEVDEGSLNMLNDDCLMHIFSFLSFKEVTAVERVCKRWQALSYRIWRCLHELNFKPGGPFAKMPRDTKSLDQYLKRCGASLTILDLTGGEPVREQHSFGDNTLAVVALHCANLEELRVSKINVAKRSLAHLGHACNRLKKLVMTDMRNVSDKDLNTLLPKCSDLTELELSHIENVDGRCLTNIKGPITQIRLASLNLHPVYLIAGLQKMSSTLESLVICSCMSTLPDAIDKIVSAVPNLVSLSLCGNMLPFMHGSLTQMGQLTKLTSLNLNFNDLVNDGALSAIVEGCGELTTLTLAGSGGGMLSERGLSMLSRIRKLIKLDISYLEATKTSVLKSITSRNCRLKYLWCRGCPNLDDEGTAVIVTLCNDLELFDLSGCNSVTGETVDIAASSVKIRTNNCPLQIIVGGTKVPTSTPPNKDVPQLTVDFADLSEEHLRPDFIDDMFFPPSDSDEDDDLDHLCCDCDFDFDDLFDPTLVNDETRRFGFGGEDDDDLYEEQWMDDGVNDFVSNSDSD